MNLNNEFDYMLVKFIYDATYFSPELTLQLRQQYNTDYRISTFLKKLYEKKILTKKEIQKLSGDYNLVKPLLEKVYDKYDFHQEGISSIVPNDEIYHILDDIEKEARPIIDELINAFRCFKASLPLSPYAFVRIYYNFDLLVKAYNVIKNKTITSEEELCNELGIIYYVGEIHWPILKQWLIDHGCEPKYLELFSHEFNGLYTWERIKQNPNVTVEELRKEID